MTRLLLFLLFLPRLSISQPGFPHPQAHAHNDYEHERPLWTALENGFTSVEADVHLVNGKLLVSHNRPPHNALTLSQLYLRPLDSLLSCQNNRIYPDYKGTFYLMIDCKTEAESTYQAIEKELVQYKRLLCTAQRCPVKIFISGNRARDAIIKNGYKGIALDGRPEDLGKGISAEMMPVISDHFSEWSTWKGKTNARPDDLEKIFVLAKRVHDEGKKLRLWAIPDNEIVWGALLEAGVDFINTDRLEALHEYLISK